MPNERLEVVEQMVAEREEIFSAAEWATMAIGSDTTPVVKKSKKRRKSKQHPTPSPTHMTHPVSSQLALSQDLQHKEEEGQQRNNADGQEDNEKVLTAVPGE